MQHFARIEEGTVREIIEIPDGADINEHFHADIVAALVPDDGGAAVGGGTWDGTAFGPVPVVLPTVDEAKAEAGRRILGVAPEWKQRNMTVRAVELLHKGEADWTTEERAEAAAMESAWAQITAIRVASDVLEAEITEGTYTGVVADWPGWPE